MALSATIYRMKIELSDIDRGVYESLDVRLAQHPSEGEERLVARALAYALCFEPGLEFGRGVSTADEPALWTHDLTGQLTHWIDVGTPSAERIHAASKRAGRVSIVCHKGRGALDRELKGKKIHRAEEIEVIVLDPALIAELAARLERSVEWTLVCNDGELSVTIGDTSLSGTYERTRLAAGE